MRCRSLQIIDSPALNAFASGVSEKNYAITLTRGIVDALDKRELEAVMAHELTHIRNRDVRLLIIAVIFVGIFSFFGELVFRNVFRTGVRIGGHASSRKGDSRGGGVLILIAIALVAIAYLLAMVIRFSLSQKREFLADAGAADLTKDPDGMIAALKKISGRSEIDAPGEVRQMMLDNTTQFAGLFATHPSIEKRIAALENYAGGAALTDRRVAGDLERVLGEIAFLRGHFRRLQFLAGRHVDLTRRSRVQDAAIGGEIEIPVLDQLFCGIGVRMKRPDIAPAFDHRIRRVDVEIGFQSRH